MPRRIEADDEVRRFTAVWLGPPGYDLPFHIRYVAYVVWFGLFVALLLIEAVTPIPIGVPPVWEFSISVLATALLMQAVDHDKPLAAVVSNAVNVARAPRARDPKPVRVAPHLGALVKVTKEPL